MGCGARKNKMHSWGLVGGDFGVHVFQSGEFESNGQFSTWFKPNDGSHAPFGSSGVADLIAKGIVVWHKGL